MSGHSKWSTIKHKKGKADAARGKVFTKIGRELSIAAREGADPTTNSRLRDAIAKAKANNMPNDNIQRTIKRASGDGDTTRYEEIMYEGYGISGVAVIAESLTDNRNRTASDIRHSFDKYGAGLGTSGCVSWMFDKKGLLLIERTDAIDEDTLMLQAIDAGAEDFSADDDVFEITTDPSDFSAVREILEKEGYTFITAERVMLPQNTIELTDEETIEKIVKLIDVLEDNDDIQNVYHNADFVEAE